MLSKGILALLKEGEKLFDWRRRDSYLSKLNEGMLFELPEKLQGVMDTAAGICLLTKGFFNPLYRSLCCWRGSGDCPKPPYFGEGFFDLDGIAKGFVAGEIGAFLANNGYPRFIVEFGGDVWAGEGPQRPWRVGIHTPGHISACGGIVLKLEWLAACTSGSYERGDHIRNPATGRGVLHPWSVTVVGPDPAVADALATAAFILGPQGDYSSFKRYMLIFCGGKGVISIVNPLNWVLDQRGP